MKKNIFIKFIMIVAICTIILVCGEKCSQAEGSDYTAGSGLTHLDLTVSDLDFSNVSVKTQYNNPAYNIYWNNNKLVLDNVTLNASIKLPSGTDILIEIINNTKINGNIIVENGDTSNITFTGKKLIVEGSIDGGNSSIVLDNINIETNVVSLSNDTSKLKLKNASHLKVKSGISVGGSGSTSGEIILGDASIIEVIGEYATISSGKFNMNDLESEIIAEVEMGFIAISSGLENAFDDIQLPEGGHIGPMYGTTYTILDNNNVPLNKFTIGKKRYNIVATTKNNGGSISDNGTTSVLPNTNKEYEITVDDGYKIKNVKVDNEDKGVISTFKFENINENHAIEVEFEKIKYVINTIIKQDGNISKNENAIVEHGDGYVTLIGINGYNFSAATIDENSYEVKDNKITLSNVVKDTNIVINYEKIVENNNGVNNKEDATNKNDENTKEDTSNQINEKTNENDNSNIINTGDSTIYIAIATILAVVILNVVIAIKNKKDK